MSGTENWVHLSQSFVVVVGEEEEGEGEGAEERGCGRRERAELRWAGGRGTTRRRLCGLFRCAGRIDRGGVVSVWE